MGTLGVGTGRVFLHRAPSQAFPHLPGHSSVACFSTPNPTASFCQAAEGNFGTNRTTVPTHPPQWLADPVPAVPAMPCPPASLCVPPSLWKCHPSPQDPIRDSPDTSFHCLSLGKSLFWLISSTRPSPGGVTALLSLSSHPIQMEWLSNHPLTPSPASKGL